MSKQWGHGYHVGVDEGMEYGYERGLSVPAMMEGEQMDVLIETMAYLFRNEEIGPRHWALLRTMSQINAKHMMSPERAWHERGCAPSSAWRGETEKVGDGETAPNDQAQGAGGGLIAGGSPGAAG